MAQKTITEALADLKTIAKRIQKKQDFVYAYIGRVEAERDPLEKEEGGSVGALARERQAINDLHQETIAIRRAIQHANETTNITVEGMTRSIADWLIWRREVAPNQKAMLEKLRIGVTNVRAEAKKRDVKVIEPGSAGDRKDIIINISEADLARDLEQMELVLGTLDGQLSLKNATVVVEV